MDDKRKLCVGIIGAGEVAQHCASKFHIPQATTDPNSIFANPKVDVVFILTSDEYHETYVISALEAGKYVMVEKPITLSVRSARQIVEAEREVGGKRVFVGYMRRYAPSFTRAFKREVASIPRILYARVRDFNGPNASFVAESGTFPVKNTDVPPEVVEARTKLLDEFFADCFTCAEVEPQMQQYCRFLGSLGSHDISLMRETLGFPESVAGVSVHAPFYSAIFNYENASGEPFAVTYESGIDEVPNFDAHLAVYGQRKRVSIHYPSPYVKGLPITVKVDEVNEHGERQYREILSSYEDAYTAELQELYACIVDGKEIKTSAEDAMDDLRIFDMMYKKCDETHVWTDY